MVVQLHVRSGPVRLAGLRRCCTESSAGARPRLIEVEMLRVRTSDDDRKIADEVGHTWDAVAHASLDNMATACGVLARAIASWRRGEPRARVMDSFETARQLSLAPDEVEVSPDDE